MAPDLFAGALNRWLDAHRDELPKCLAIDGKMIRERAGIVCLVEHRTGRPIAVAPCSRKEGEGEKCEIKVSQRLLFSLPDLSGTLSIRDAFFRYFGVWSSPFRLFSGPRENG